MGGLSRVQAALATAAGVGILAVGFLVGSAIGDGDDSPSPDGSSPNRIVTRDSSVDVPTLGQAKQIPTLTVEQPVASTVEEGTGSTFTPSSSTGEEPAEEAKTQSRSPPAEPEPEPEVTVAPNG